MDIIIRTACSYLSQNLRTIVELCLAIGACACAF